jgi:16S rRNA (adenine1518-N6/adenine1519-N6)-dimethyltransferase
LGQNFLVAQNVAERIVSLANLDPAYDVVLEIGPGRGLLTRLLAGAAKEVIAVEVDPEMASETRVTCAGKDNVTVVEGDILDIRWPPCTKVVANLPYSISSPVTFQLIASWDKWEEAVLMYQREFAERLDAPPGSNSYSRLSAGVEYFLEVERLMAVNRRNFQPQPRVDSLVVRLTKKTPRPELDPATYLAATQQIFPYKNKTLRNAVLFMMKKRESEVDSAQVDEELADYAARRVRTLAPPEIAELAKKLRALEWI